MQWLGSCRRLWSLASKYVWRLLVGGRTSGRAHDEKAMVWRVMSGTSADGINVRWCASVGRALDSRQGRCDCDCRVRGRVAAATQAFLLAADYSYPRSALPFSPRWMRMGLVWLILPV